MKTGKISRKKRWSLLIVLTLTAVSCTLEAIMQSITIMYSKLAAIQLARAEVVIKPKVGQIASFDFSKRHEAILEGEKAAMEALPHIMKIVNQLRAEGRLE